MRRKRPVTLKLYRQVARSFPLLAMPLVRKRLRAGKEHPQRISERRGVASRPRPEGPLVWVHGASVGEVLAVAALIEHLLGLGLRVLLTSGTVTSAEIVARRFPPEVIHQFIPYDAPGYVQAFYDHWRPQLALFVESDLWPNLIMSGAERRIPMILINGRLSERSFGRWRHVRGTIGALLGDFDLCLAQSAADAERFSALGAARVATTGNLKLDLPAPPADPERLERLHGVVRGRDVFVAASTHPGEDEVFIAAHRQLRRRFPGLLTILVPRHPQRGEAVAALVAEARLAAGLRSRGELPSARMDIYVADTLGELGLFYRLAPVVFMGGSLIAHGGQNPIEALKLGAAVLHGPNVWNFGDLYAALDRAGGAEVIGDEAALVTKLTQWLSQPSLREASAQAGRQVVDDLGGALDKTLAALEPYLLQLRIEAEAPHA